MTDPVATPPQRSRSRHGCMKGCGGCLIALILLAAAAWFGYARYGAPWLETQTARLSERFPALGALVRLKDSLPLQGMTLAGGEMGSRDAADFPADLWLPPSAVDQAFNTAERSALASLMLPGEDAASLAAEIRSEMETRGWSRTPVPDPHNGLALLFEKDGRIVSYLLYPRQDRLQVLIKSYGASATP